MTIASRFLFNKYNVRIILKMKLYECIILSESQQKWRISIFEGFTNREILY